ncbi:MAG: P63C domain-containing protein [Acidobacteriota bacterium]
MSPRFVGGKVISEAMGAELLKRIDNPLVFNGPTMVGQPPSRPIYGYDVTILIDVCKAIVTAEADGRLLKSQSNIAKQAHIILSASAKAGIKGLVYALAGYDVTKQEVIAAFKFYVSEEAREYEKEFPDQLYSEWYRLYELPKVGTSTRPWKFKHLTVDQVYKPLAKSNGKILQLTREMRDNSTKRHRKLHQFLSEIGVKALRTHLGQLLGIARVSKTKENYEKNFRILFDDQFEFDLDEAGE